jgi:CheY-like chemotaxis protein
MGGRETASECAGRDTGSVSLVPPVLHLVETVENPSEVNVLVVEDNDDLRSSMSDILRTVGYTVIEAADGEDALNLVTTMRFDAMVLDLKMPRRDGASLLSALSEPPAVVVVSAFELDDETRHRAGSTIVAHLSKPVPPQQLLDAVADAVIGEERS